MAKKVDKTEDKILAVENALGKGEQFLEKNKNLLFYVLLGIIVVIGGVFAYNKFVRIPKEREAQSVMFYAEQYFEQDSLDLAINGDGTNPGFLQIVDDYGSTKQGNLARYYLGICYLKTGEYQAAIDNLEDFDSDDHIVAPMALGAIGDAYMELGETEKAINYYQKAAEKDNNDFTAPMFLIKAGWAYESLNQWDKAIEVYTKIKKEHFKSFEARDIEKYIAYAKGMQETK
ncbi:MAG TPA: tetratricopeptide repeat protein [Bacteroidales bacterium]|jgi:tetratricopeptide (TPR) repeat protein|nr:tetratricopeptide repeat protein [Paludibacteraceae bacterium]HOH83986.1 tetratricopeptide repeat protein [Bacteroidales bacterium]HPI29986.1 tetratricopeptide repeat protein [Bacteroidales bacterium]HQN16505.1 tetratricopeptide repeat protein [Bacteroidales bacterium]HQP16169.1 tetratricopeptide repeat protein [Bacteroidales bacterium]